MEDYKIAIRDFNILFDKYRANKREKIDGKQLTYSLEDDEAVISILETLQSLYHMQIHDSTRIITRNIVFNTT